MKEKSSKDVRTKEWVTIKVEKGVDVALATELLLDPSAQHDPYDTIVIITGDGDLEVAIKTSQRKRRTLVVSLEHALHASLNQSVAKVDGKTLWLDDLLREDKAPRAQEPRAAAGGDRGTGAAGRGGMGKGKAGGRGQSKLKGPRKGSRLFEAKPAGPTQGGTPESQEPDKEVLEASSSSDDETSSSSEGGEVEAGVGAGEGSASSTASSDSAPVISVDESSDPAQQTAVESTSIFRSIQAMWKSRDASAQAHTR